MKLIRYIYFLLLHILCVSCHYTPTSHVSVHPCSPMPNSGLACATACELNGKGYIFGGRTQNGNYTNDLWEYNPQTDDWTQISTFPGKERINAIMVSDGESIYVGLGFSKGRVYVDSCYLQDFWRFTPEDGQWEKLAPYPSTNTIRGVPYVLNQHIYIACGTGWSHTNELTCYDIITNKWSIINPHESRIDARFGGAGGVCKGRCFFGTGLNRKNTCQWYEIDLPNDEWFVRSSIPGKGRTLCAYCATDEYIYLFGGRYFAGEHTGGEVFGDYMRYHILNDYWEFCGAMPSGLAENMIAFTINGKAYYGLGENENGQLINTLYRIEE